MKENVILSRSFEFAIRIIRLYREMSGKNEFVLSKQLLRSGTSIGANVQEAQAALTRKEFTCKMSGASKEARETQYWLMLIRRSELFPRLTWIIHKIVAKNTYLSENIIGAI